MFPDFDQFAALAQGHPIVPVYVEMIADHLTPVGVYAALRSHHTISYLLESVVGQEKWGRYSFIGCDPDVYLRAKDGLVETMTRVSEGQYTSQIERSDAPFDALRARLKCSAPAPVDGLPRFWGGAVGYVAYDAVRWFEPKALRTKRDHASYDYGFALGGTVVIFDNVRHSVKVVQAVHAPASKDSAALRASYAEAQTKLAQTISHLNQAAPLRALELTQKADAVQTDSPPLTASHTSESFAQAVRRAQDHIRSGDVFQLVLSQRFETSCDGINVFDVYRVMRMLNPSPYMFFLDFPEQRVAGASPEVMVRLEDGVAEVRPIAGTKPRGQNADEDSALEQALLADPKERAEHVMLVDLGRNDLGRVCKTGSVKVTEQMAVERYSHVMHIVSSVQGHLQEERDALDLLAATFPAGTLTGAPKVRAVQLIDALEPAGRGLYGGAVGYLSYAGNMDMAIAIRTLVERNNAITVQVGAGIVEASDPDSEYEETLNKSLAVRKAIEVARMNTNR